MLLNSHKNLLGVSGADMLLREYIFLPFFNSFSSSWILITLRHHTHQQNTSKNKPVLYFFDSGCTALSLSIRERRMMR